MTREGRKLATYEFRILIVGERFPGFGGSRHDLLVRKTASLVVRHYDHTSGTLKDTEYNIGNAGIWKWFADVANQSFPNIHTRFEGPESIVEAATRLGTN